MKTKIQKWGNSLALRIPKLVANDLGLAQDSIVELTMTKKTLVVAPAARPTVRLAELLEKVVPRNIHGEVDFGSPKGHEAW